MDTLEGSEGRGLLKRELEGCWSLASGGGVGGNRGVVGGNCCLPVLAVGGALLSEETNLQKTKATRNSPILFKIPVKEKKLELLAEGEH